MLDEPAIAMLNHVLVQSGWALPRLQAFAGRTVRLKLLPLSLVCTINEDGTLRSAAPDSSEDAACTASPSLVPLLALHDDEALARVTRTGDAALTGEVIYLARNLRWDAAEDLSRITGDIAAERIVRTANSVHRHARDTARNFLQALAEYWTEERPVIAKPGVLASFDGQVGELSNRLDELEQRIQQLEGDQAQRNTNPAPRARHS